MIIEAAWITICKDVGLGSLYLRYKERMKPQEAIVRIARKLSNIIFAILKNEKEYVPYYTGNWYTDLLDDFTERLLTIVDEPFGFLLNETVAFLPNILKK